MEKASKRPCLAPNSHTLSRLGVCGVEARCTLYPILYMAKLENKIK
jgi:hypothetical protein